MPKSSRTTRTPISRSRFSVAIASWMSPIATLSVISSSRRSGGEARGGERAPRRSSRGRRGGTAAPRGSPPRTRRAAPPDGNCARLRARLAQDPLAHRHDQARVLGERDEGVGREEAALRVLPAHERLRADDRARREHDLGLEVEDELPVVRRRAAGPTPARGARGSPRSGPACRAGSCSGRAPWRGRARCRRCAGARRRRRRRRGRG